ncbi:hypothetical protein E4T39_04486 [Aureobasidium subglaciale]|nr:hypothetical protein E4T39_04486 [Aureobasidium subglaciale]
MRSVALALAYLATGIHALPKPALSYAVVNVDGGSASTSTPAAQTTVVSTLVESEVPTTVSQTVYKTVTESIHCGTHIFGPPLYGFFNISTTFGDTLDAISIALLIEVYVSIYIVHALAIIFKHSITLFDNLDTNATSHSILDEHTTVVSRVIDVSYAEEQRNNKH